MHDVHTTGIRKGSTPLTDLGRLTLALLVSVAIVGPVGEATGGVVLTPGAGYTSIPAATAADGSGATITPSMALGTAAIGAAGVTYAPGDTVTLTGGTAATQAIIEVQTTKAVTAPAVAAGGSGYTVGDTITCQNGLVLTVATLSTTAVATVTIANGGSFTTNNTSAGGLTQISSSGAGTGATFTMTAAKYGVNTFSVQNAGLYSVLPSSPVAQGSTSGSGTGFTLAVSTWQVGSISATGGNNYKHGSAITFSGGGGTTQATGQVGTLPIGEAVVVPVTGLMLPSTYGVQATPNGPSHVSCNGKSINGFNLLVRPLSTTEPVVATALDVIAWA